MFLQDIGKVKFAEVHTLTTKAAFYIHEHAILNVGIYSAVNTTDHVLVNKTVKRYGNLSFVGYSL